MASSKTRTTLSYFYCTNCGNSTIPLPRKTAKQKSPGHLKKMYCPHCKEIYNCYECHDEQDIEEFKERFKNGEFKDCNDALNIMKQEKKELIYYESLF